MFVYLIYYWVGCFCCCFFFCIIALWWFACIVNCCVIVCCFVLCRVSLFSRLFVRWYVLLLYYNVFSLYWYICLLFCVTLNLFVNSTLMYPFVWLNYNFLVEFFTHLFLCLNACFFNNVLVWLMLLIWKCEDVSLIALSLSYLAFLCADLNAFLF